MGEGERSDPKPCDRRPCMGGLQRLVDNCRQEWEIIPKFWAVVIAGRMPPLPSLRSFSIFALLYPIFLGYRPPLPCPALPPFSLLAQWYPGLRDLRKSSILFDRKGLSGQKELECNFKFRKFFISARRIEVQHKSASDDIKQPLEIKLITRGTLPLTCGTILFGVFWI